MKDLVSVSLGDTVHCRNSKLDIVTDARVIELEWDAVKNEIYRVTLGDYQFDYISNQMSLNNRIQSAIRSDGSVIGSQVQGILNAAKAQFHAMREVAQKQDIRAMLFEDLDPKCAWEPWDLKLHRNGQQTERTGIGKRLEPVLDFLQIL